MALYQKSELDQIEQTIAAVEENTSAEIVVVTVPRSDSYAEVRIAFSAVVGFLLVSIIHVVWHDFAATWLLSLQLGFSALVWPLTAQPGLLRALIPDGLAQRAVEQSAELAFLEHALFETRDRNGVLLLVSELEHRVAVLGDSGIHGHLKDAGFVELVEHLTKSIQEGRAGQGTCEVIERLGKALSTMSPSRAGDNPNELDNRVRVGTVEARRTREQGKDRQK